MTFYLLSIDINFYFNFLSNISILFYLIVIYFTYISVHNRYFVYLCLLFFYNNIQSTHIVSLGNSLSIIHPIIILLTPILALIILRQNIIYINLFYMGLFLGGYWSLQEYNWGGWWNWDFIETPIFIIYIYITFLLHIVFNKYIRKINIYMYIYQILLLLLFVNFLNKNFVNNSIHSFSKENFFKVYFLYNIIYFYPYFIFILFYLFNIKNAIYIYVLIKCINIILIYRVIRFLTKVRYYFLNKKNHIFYIYTFLLLLLKNKNLIKYKYFNFHFNYKYSYNSNIFIDYFGINIKFKTNDYWSLVKYNLSSLSEVIIFTNNIVI